MRDVGTVRGKAVHLALVVLPDGSRDILGIWTEQIEGAKLWLKVFTDLQTRGCHDILIAVTDGLKGMSEALAAVQNDLRSSPLPPFLRCELRSIRPLRRPTPTASRRS
jgi:transposase-like protein